MPGETKPRPGGQLVNQYAHRTGYSSGVFTSAAKANITRATHIIGLEDEIALLRAGLKSLVISMPVNVRLIAHLASTVARLIRTNQKLGFETVAHVERKRLASLFVLAPALGLSKAEIIAFILAKLIPSRDVRYYSFL